MLANLYFCVVVVLNPLGGCLPLASIQIKETLPAM